MSRPLTVLQLLPELEVGGVERGTVEIARALSAAGHRALVVSAPGRLVGELTACGAEHIALDVGAKRLASLAHVARLARLYREHAVDIVHARSRLPAWLGRLAWRRLPAAARPHWVTTVHGPYTVNAYSAVMVSGERVIAISEFIRDYIRANYPRVEPGRITVIPRGVDATRYHAGFSPTAAWHEHVAAEYPRLAGKRLLVLPARLTRWKGQEDFLAMVARVRAVRDDVHALVIGGAHAKKPGYRAELETLAARLGIADAVSFLGHRDDLREWLAHAAIAYSLTDAPEAFGRTTVEALALGTPVIGYDHGGTGEILARVYPAGRVRHRDVEAAAARTLDLLAHPVAVPRDQPYTVAALQQATLALYAELASSP